jgi:hypothetical protein
MTGLTDNEKRLEQGTLPARGIWHLLGSTRPNRNGEQVAKWVHDITTVWDSGLWPAAALQHGKGRESDE